MDVSTTRHVALCVESQPGNLCWLAISDLGDVVMSSVLQECEVLTLDTYADNCVALRSGDGQLALSASAHSSVLIGEPPNLRRSLCLKANSSFLDGVSFTLQESHEDAAPRAIALADDGSFVLSIDQTRACSFRIARSFTLGAVLGLDVLRLLDGKEVALWNPSVCAWLTAHPAASSATAAFFNRDSGKVRLPRWRRYLRQCETTPAYVHSAPSRTRSLQPRIS